MKKKAEAIYMSITSYSNRSELGGIDKEWIIKCIEKGLNEVKNNSPLPDVSNSKAELCRCFDYEGTAEDGTCYYCGKKLRDDYPA